MFADGDAELDLAADMLANGKTSRLYRRLVFDERIATDVSAVQNSREIGGFLQVAATAAPGHTLAELERSIVDEIARLAADGPTADEIDRGRVQAEAQFMFRLQTVGGFGGKSDQLNAYNVFVGDPAFFERDLERYGSVTTESLQADGAAIPEPRPPCGAQHRAARPARSRAAGFRSADVSDAVRIDRRAPTGCLDAVIVDRSSSRRARPPRPFHFPAIDKSALPNGLRVWTVRHPAIPVVTLMLLVRRGAADDPPGQEGLAAITLDMLDEGSGGRSAIEMHEALGRLGAQLDSDIGSDAMLAGHHGPQPLHRPGADAARRHRGAPVARSRHDFERVRQLRLHRLTQLRDMPGAVADRAFVRLLYGDHPYGHTPLGNEQTLGDMTVDDVRALSSGGDASVRGDARGRRRLRSRRHRPARRRRVRRVGKAGRPASRRREVAVPRPARLNVVPRAGAPQSELRIGHVAVPAGHARLSRARRGQHGARRPVRQPHQPESARGQGVHLRRPHRVRLPPAARAVRAAGAACRRRPPAGRSRNRSPRSPRFAARGR